VKRAAILAITFAVFALAARAPAALHHPTDNYAVPFSDKGEVRPLAFDEFRRQRLVLRNVGNPNWPLVSTDPATKEPVLDPVTKQPRKTERGVVMDRVTAAKRKPNRTVEENVALAIDLLRLSQAPESESALKGARNGYLPNTTLSHIAAAQGDWPRAFNYLDIANEERPPTAIPGLSADQLAWQLKLNRGALLKLVQLRMKEARGAKLLPENELPDDLFGVQFVSAAGEYEPGALAPDQAAKLPPDALATVQQLVLWFPYDARLYWLLGELYAAKGDVREAQKVMDELVDTMTYSNRKVLMAHREVVARKVEELPPPKNADDEPIELPIGFRGVWVYFGVAVLFGLIALVRAILRAR
jgi:tetratricopeptide (TPR) repeat protein